ncbi:MAG: hypothetical protein HQK52_11750 [Oligoflexia bacterium]|nr:hypothetical protein [Oligoflexia bacterium]
MKNIIFIAFALICVTSVQFSFIAAEDFSDPCVGSSATVKSCLKSVREKIDVLERESEAHRYGFIVYNSVANVSGVTETSSDVNTHNFWKIFYSDRFKNKGNCMAGPEVRLTNNCYNPTLYQLGPAIFTDVVEDINGKVAVMFSAAADGIDEVTMKMKNPRYLSGHVDIYFKHFASGWSSVDTNPPHDNDPWVGNCGTQYESTQHYDQCWLYNIGSDAGMDEGGGTNADSNWGPHLHAPSHALLGLARGNDTSGYVRVKRITRYIFPIK